MSEPQPEKLTMSVGAFICTAFIWAILAPVIGLAAVFCGAALGGGGIAGVVGAVVGFGLLRLLGRATAGMGRTPSIRRGAASGTFVGIASASCCSAGVSMRCVRFSGRGQRARRDTPDSPLSLAGRLTGLRCALFARPRSARSNRG